MAEDHIRYDILVQDALRGVIRKVLAEVAKTGLPGDHHFQITFRTKAPGVRLATRLLAQYPEEMTIILQHQFWDLTVTDSAFEVGLSFGGIPERLLVPFAAIRAFVDGAVGFALQFEPERAESEAEAEETAEAEEAATEAAKAIAEPPKPPAVVPEKPADASAEVVSLEAFRKKN